MKITRLKAKGNSFTPTFLLLVFFFLSFPHQTVAQTNNYQVTINSNKDGEIFADKKLTLREAITISNGASPLEKLSPQERELVKPTPGNLSINFN